MKEYSWKHMTMRAFSREELQKMTSVEIQNINDWNYERMVDNHFDDELRFIVRLLGTDYPRQHRHRNVLIKVYDGYVEIFYYKIKVFSSAASERFIVPGPWFDVIKERLKAAELKDAKDKSAAATYKHKMLVERFSCLEDKEKTMAHCTECYSDGDYEVCEDCVKCVGGCCECNNNDPLEEWERLDVLLLREGTLRS